MLSKEGNILLISPGLAKSVFSGLLDDKWIFAIQGI